jgi:predicted component of type VI protein secretion system
MATDLQSRVQKLEAQMAQVQAAMLRPGQIKTWRQAVDKYAGDSDLLAVFAAAKKLREADRKKARQGRVKRRPS